jgi:hypothetical protein
MLSFHVKAVPANLVKVPPDTVVKKVIRSFVLVAMHEMPEEKRKLVPVALRIRKWV